MSSTFLTEIFRSLAKFRVKTTPCLFLTSQVNWVRYVAGMKRRSDFKNAASFAGAFMTVIYVALGLYGYHILGSSFDFEQVHSIFSCTVLQAVILR